MPRVKPLMEVLRGVTCFGRLTVIGEAPRIISPSGFSALAAHVRCECGNAKVVRARDLVSGYSHSCGCLQRELTAIKIADRSRTHGQSVGQQTPEYRAWSAMKTRCGNPAVKSYPRYGGRGIAICPRWLQSFEAFLEDMGKRPSDKHSIDRIDVDGNYEPNNCRWATPSEQALNRRTSTKVLIGDRTQTVIEWARETGVNAQLIYQRLRRGEAPLDAVFAPKRRPIRGKHTYG